MGTPRTFKPITGSLVDDQKEIKSSWTATGSSSNPTLTSNQKKNGLVSVTRTAAGKFTLVFTGNYGPLKGFAGTALLTATGSASGNATVTPITWDGSAAAGATLTVAVHLAGTLSDLTVLDTIMVALDVSTSALEAVA